MRTKVVNYKEILVMFMKTQIALFNLKYTVEKKLDERKARQYDEMIKASQAKLAETKLVPGCTQIWC
jgi:hypothetical protein